MAAQAAAGTPDCEKEISPHCADSYSIKAEDNHWWVAFSQSNVIYLSVSNDRGKSFSSVKRISGTNEDIYSGGEHRPKLAVKGEKIYLSWTKKLPGRFKGDIRFSQSLDGGEHFSAPITVNDDDLKISHRFDELAVANNGDIYITWLDKRNKVYAEQQGKTYHGAAAYYALSHNGIDFENRLIANHSCECCRMSAAALDDNIAVMWRHIFPGSIRDHAIALLNKKGVQTHSRSSYENWELHGCPHHGPQISTDSNRQIHAAWFSGAEKKAGLYYARFDETLHSQTLLPIDTRNGASHPDIFAQRENIHIAWTRFDGEKTHLLVSASSDSGNTWNTKQRIASDTRTTDYAQLFSDGEKVFLSWLIHQKGIEFYALD
jgi:hypothetical protein